MKFTKTSAIALIVAVVAMLSGINYLSRRTGHYLQPKDTSSSTTPPAAAAATPAPPIEFAIRNGVHFSLTPLPETVVAGTTLSLTAHSPALGRYQYRWYVKYAERDWDMNSQFHDLPDYKIIPQRDGKYAVQLDVRATTDTALVESKWLGEFMVAGATTETVNTALALEAKSLAPVTIAMPNDAIASATSADESTATLFAPREPDVTETIKPTPPPTPTPSLSPITFKGKGGSTFKVTALPPTACLGTTYTLTIENAHANDYEYRWGIKHNKEPWVSSWQFDRSPFLSFIPNELGTYAFQVDIRRTSGTAKVASKWIGQIILSDAAPQAQPQLDSTATLAGKVDHIEFPALPPIADLSKSLSLSIGTKSDNPIEFRWYVKYGKEKWIALTDWSSKRDMTLTPPKMGPLALQVDIRDKDTKRILMHKWLGVITVNGNLIKNLFVSPSGVSLPAGTELTFNVQASPDYPLEDLEFRLIELHPPEDKGAWDYKEVQKWQAWPLHPYALPDTPKGTMALQVGIRLKANPLIIQKKWMGQYYPYVSKPDKHANLLRSLIADDFDLEPTANSNQVLADELNLSLHLMLWQKQSALPADQTKKIRALANIKSVSQVDPSNTNVQYASMRSYNVDLAGMKLHEQDSPLEINVGLKDFPQYSDMLTSCSTLTENQKIMAGFVLAIFEGYRYGTPPNGTLESMCDTISHCASSSYQLLSLLRAIGYHAKVITMDDPEAGAHVIVQSNAPGEKPILLDTTMGCVYAFGVENFGKTAIPKPILLQSDHILDSLNLTTFFKPGKTEFAIIEDFEPGVVPLRAKKK